MKHNTSGEEDMDNGPQNTPQPQFNAPEPITPTEPAPVTPPTFPTEPTPMKPPKKSKKKIVIMTLIALVVAGIIIGVVFFIGQMNSKPAVNNDTGADSELTVTNSEVGAQLQKNGKQVLLSSILGVSAFAPNYTLTTNGFSKILTTNNYFLIFCRSHDAISMPLSEIIQYNFDVFDNTTGASIGFGEPQSMTTVSSEEMTINGIDTLRFEGSIHYLQSFNNTETDNYVMGYTFIVKGIPSQLLGVSTDADKKPETVENIKKDLDAMMQTIKIE